MKEWKCSRVDSVCLKKKTRFTGLNSSHGRSKNVKGILGEWGTESEPAAGVTRATSMMCVDIRDEYCMMMFQ